MNTVQAEIQTELSLFSFICKGFEFDKSEPIEHSISDYEKAQIDGVVSIVLKTFNGITIEDLKSKSRKREVVNPRKACVYFIIRNYPLITLKTIGRYFGERDHSTIIWANDTIKDHIKNEKAFRELIGKIENDLTIEQTI